MNRVLRHLHNALLFLARFYLFPLYFVSGMVPRRRNLWVFGSWGGHRYADNAAACFEYCHERINGSITLVWISRDASIVSRLRARGWEAHWLWSPRGVIRCLRAGLHVFDCFPKDTNFWLSRGATKVNLWSGVPLKTFERDIDNRQNRYHRLFHGNPVERFFLGMMMPWHVNTPDLIIAMSEETQEITRRAFALSEEQVVVTGFPRNDILFRETSADGSDPSLPAVFREAVEAGRKIFLYLPTFRDSGKPFLEIDWAHLDSLMKELDAVFFFKFHPVDGGAVPSHFERIFELTQDTDVYSLLGHADALVSDYSSIIFDYMLLERPIVYYTPDHESFISSSRALNFDPEEIAVGPLCRTYTEFAGILRAVVEDPSSVGVPEQSRSAIMQRLHRYVDGESNRRVLEVIDRTLMSGTLLEHE